VLLGGIAATLLLVALTWWPLVRDYFAQWDWRRPFLLQVDWLLLFDFAVMFLLVMAHADLRRDALVLLVGQAGGALIESWGTRTHLWTYYTHESPPLWILPAWPIATLAIDRLTAELSRRTERWPARIFDLAYWPVFLGFGGLLLAFVAPTLGQPLSLAAVALLLVLILAPQDRRMELLAFTAGSVLGYFLERWGTTRECWVYYTGQTPPLFAVLAHGMAAVAFWRTTCSLRRLRLPVPSRRAASAAD
jgi:ribose/xylose/arabinose/galactoside ABC-type transport system permease subunit